MWTRDVIARWLPRPYTYMDLEAMYAGACGLVDHQTKRRWQVRTWLSLKPHTLSVHLATEADFDLLDARSNHHLRSEDQNLRPQQDRMQGETRTA